MIAGALIARGIGPDRLPNPSSYREVRQRRSIEAQLEDLGISGSTVDSLFDAAGPAISIPSAKWGQSLGDGVDNLLIQVLGQLNVDLQQRISTLKENGVARLPKGWPTDNKTLSCFIAGALIARGVDPGLLVDPTSYRRVKERVDGNG